MNTSRFFTYLLLGLVGALLVGGFVFNIINNAALDKRLAILEQNLTQSQNALGRLASTTDNEQSQIASLQQFARKQGASVPVVAKTQEQILTAVVAKVAPAVVSVVVSKAVPQLEVVYVDPFGGTGDDSGIRIPVYRQKGTALEKVGAGSGFMVNRNGYIVTNKHVVADAQASYTVLLSNGNQQSATVLYRDPGNDMAVLKIAGQYASAIPLGDSSSLSLGQSVVAIGNALGEYNNSVSVGIISGLNRTIEAADQITGQIEKLTGIIQTDAAINPGNSGGPLIDLNGNVVGINVATVQGSNNIGFAIPINSVKNTIQNIIR
jgi:serine protease Do